MSSSKIDSLEHTNQSARVQEALTAESTLVEENHAQDSMYDHDATFDLKVNEPPTLKLLPHQVNQLMTPTSTYIPHYSTGYTSKHSSDQLKAHATKTSHHKGLFDRLSKPLQEVLLQQGARMRYLKGQAMNEIGEPCRGLSLIMRGMARVDVMDALQ